MPDENKKRDEVVDPQTDSWSGTDDSRRSAGNEESKLEKTATERPMEPEDLDQDE